MMWENKYITYFWLKYNVNLLKKRKYDDVKYYSFVIYASGYFISSKTANTCICL